MGKIIFYSNQRSKLVLTGYRFHQIPNQNYKSDFFSRKIIPTFSFLSFFFQNLDKAIKIHDLDFKLDEDHKILLHFYMKLIVFQLFGFKVVSLNHLAFYSETTSFKGKLIRYSESAFNFGFSRLCFMEFQFKFEVRSFEQNVGLKIDRS